MTAREELAAALGELGPDEVRVVALVAKRLVMGAKQYGKLRIQHDARDWIQEAGEESLDLAVYLACDVLRRERAT